MNKILHIYTDGGLAGDMFLSAFLNLGVPLEYIIEGIRLIKNLPDFGIKQKIISKQSIAATIIEINIISPNFM